MEQLSYLEIDGKQLEIADESARSTADTAINTANTAKSTADSANNVAGSAKSTAETAIDAAETAAAIAKGRNQAHVFNTTDAMKSWLSDANNKGIYNKGDNIYIVDVGVPDWWVSEVLQDADIETGYYYKIAQLETQKVDLTEINAEISQINSSLSDKVSGFSADTYQAVTGLAYDATNKKLGLKVGADTVIPFNGGVSEFAFFIMHLASQANDGFIYCNDTFNSLSNNSNTIVSNEYIGERIRYSRINSQQAGFYAVTNGKYGRKDQTHTTFEIIDAKAGDLLGTATGSNHEIFIVAL